jgi:hypothetical protein
MPSMEEMFASNMAMNGPPPAPPTGGIPPQYGGMGAPSMAAQPIAPPDVGGSAPMPDMSAAVVIPRRGIPDQPQMAPLPPFPQRPGGDEAIIGNPASNPNDGVLKRMLMNFAYGASEAIKTKLGMPTEVELQEKKYQNDVRQWQMAAQARQQEFQNQNIIADNARAEAEFSNRLDQQARAAADKGQNYIKRDEYTDLYTTGISQGKTPAEAATWAHAITQKPDENAPTIKTIAGRDMEWDKATRTWVDKGPHKAEQGTPLIGSWSLQQMTDPTGKVVTVQYNNKTGEMKPAPAGMITHVDAKEISTAYGAVQDAQTRYNKMKADIAAIARNPQNAGSYDIDLLFNHLAMTAGAVKGTRSGRDIIEEHLRARSMPEWWNVMAEKVLRGDQLSPAQRENFLHLASTTLGEARRKHAAITGYHTATPFDPATSSKKASDPNDPLGIR